MQTCAWHEACRERQHRKFALPVLLKKRVHAPHGPQKALRMSGQVLGHRLVEPRRQRVVRGGTWPSRFVDSALLVPRRTLVQTLAQRQIPPLPLEPVLADVGVDRGCHVVGRLLQRGARQTGTRDEIKTGLGANRIVEAPPHVQQDRVAPILRLSGHGTHER